MCGCKESFVFSLITPWKMKRGLIAFHLAYVQVARVQALEAFVLLSIIHVLQALAIVVSFKGVIRESKNVAGT